MLLSLSLIAAANAEPHALPESNPEKYEEVTKFLEDTAIKARSLIASGQPLIINQKNLYSDLTMFNLGQFIKDGNFPTNLLGNLQLPFGYAPIIDKLPASAYYGDDFEPYGNPVIMDKIVSSTMDNYCYGGVRRFTSTGKTYDMEMVEVEEMSQRYDQKITDPNDDHAHPKSQTCISVRLSKWQTDPVRKLGDRADAERKRYGEFNVLTEDQLHKAFDYKLVEDTVLKSNSCVFETESYNFKKDDANNFWLEPGPEMKEDWERKVESICDDFTDYRAPSDK